VVDLTDTPSSPPRKRADVKPAASTSGTVTAAAVTVEASAAAKPKSTASNSAAVKSFFGVKSSPAVSTAQSSASTVHASDDVVVLEPVIQLQKQFSVEDAPFPTVSHVTVASALTAKEPAHTKQSGGIQWRSLMLSTGADTVTAAQRQTNVRPTADVSRRAVLELLPWLQAERALTRASSPSNTARSQPTLSLISGAQRCD